MVGFTQPRCKVQLFQLLAKTLVYFLEVIEQALESSRVDFGLNLLLVHAAYSTACEGVPPEPEQAFQHRDAESWETPVTDSWYEPPSFLCASASLCLIFRPGGRSNFIYFHQ